MAPHTPQTAPRTTSRRTVRAPTNVRNQRVNAAVTELAGSPEVMDFYLARGSQEGKRKIKPLTFITVAFLGIASLYPRFASATCKRDNCVSVDNAACNARVNAAYQQCLRAEADDRTRRNCPGCGRQENGSSNNPSVQSSPGSVKSAQ